MKPQLSIIVVNYRSSDALEHCLRSIHVAASMGVEVIVVDNSPHEYDARNVLKQSHVPAAYFSPGQNIGYAVAANLGAKHANGEYLCFLQPDVVLGAHSLDRLVAWVEQHPQTVAGPRQLNTRGKIIDSVWRPMTRRMIWGLRRLSEGAYVWPYRHTHHPRPASVLDSSCLVMPRAVWEKVGEWNTSLVFFGLEAEWFERAREQGIPAWYLPQAEVHHEQGVSMRRIHQSIVSEQKIQGRRWYARRKGWLVLTLLLMFLWLERQLRHPSRLPPEA